MIPLNFVPYEQQSRIARWMNAVLDHDPDLYRHSLLVSKLAQAFAVYVDLPLSEQNVLALSGLLHDIGKLTTSAELLHKSGSLSVEEFNRIRTHAQAGYDLLYAEGGHDSLVLTVVRDHHERLDGSGYPRGLFARDIPVAVRIITLCDVYAAITEPRPYATSLSWNQALNRMAEKRTRLDMQLLAEFAAMLKVMHLPQAQSAADLTMPCLQSIYGELHG